jgi:hypothetical protein
MKCQVKIQYDNSWRRHCGSDGGGLSVTCRTKVLLIEKNSECGGLVNSFTRDGFHFDAGVRALEDAGIIFPMLKDLGIQLDVVKSPVSLGVGNEIIHIEGQDSLKEYRELLVKFFPESKDEIDQVIKIIRKIMKHMDVLYGIENPVFKDLKRDRAFVFKKLLPWLPKFIFTVGKINRLNMPVEDYLGILLKILRSGYHFTAFLQKHTGLFRDELLLIIPRLFLSQGRSGKTCGGPEEQNNRAGRRDTYGYKNY